MDTARTNDFQRRVLEELVAIRADNAAITAENAGLRHEVGSLRSMMLDHVDRPNAKRRPEEAGRTPESAGLSRGQFLRLGGATAAGAVVAGATGLLHADPAVAATGSALLIGTTGNRPTNNDTTMLHNGSSTALASSLFRVSNETDVTILDAARIAIAGSTSGSDDTDRERIGVCGRTDSLGHFGVAGQRGFPTFDRSLMGPAGVLGTADDGQTGVVGAANGITGKGVLGTSNAGFGVIGRSESGRGVLGSSTSNYGVLGSSAFGVALYAQNGARDSPGRIGQGLSPEAGPPTSGLYVKGEQIRDKNGELWLCVAASIKENGGTWRRAATVKEGYAGGSMNMLSKPIRLYDSRTGPKLAGGASVDVQITGVVIGGVSVPAGAVGVVGNITVTETQAPSGYLTLYAQGSPPNPATSNVNWFAANQNLNAAAVVPLNPITGKLTVHNGMLGGSVPTHAIFDATAFVF